MFVLVADPMDDRPCAERLHIERLVVVVVMVMVMLFFFRFIVRKGRLITTLFLNCLLGMVRVVFFRCFTLRKRRLLMILILGMVMMLFFWWFTLRKRRFLMIIHLGMVKAMIL